MNARAALVPGLDPARQRLFLASVAAFIAIATAQLADLTTFIAMVTVAGIGAEANPFVAHIAQSLGLGVLVAAKVGLIAFVALTFAIVAPVSQRLAVSVLTVATASGLIGAFSNVVALS